MSNQDFYDPLNNLICRGCNKMAFFCMCRASSDPYESLQRLKGTKPDGVEICEDVTKQKCKVPKLADSLREIALKVNQEFCEKEAGEVYSLFLDRCRNSAQSGNFKVTFFKSNFSYRMDSIQLAISLLEKEGFVVNVVPNKGYEESDTEITISWQ